MDEARLVKTMFLAGLGLVTLSTCSAPAVRQVRETVGAAAQPHAPEAHAASNELARALVAARQEFATGDPIKRDLALALSIGAPARAIVVDTGSARLWLLEKGQVVDTMKVVVGKPGMSTPDMAGRIQYATLNPYWNVPPDLVRDKLAPRVVRHGADYLSREGYEVVDRYGVDARPIDPRTVDWAAVANGTRRVGIRQLPGPTNMMGAVKFIFPNNLGIYLHDTPGRWAFDRADRRLSSGCVRVERATDLYRWLFGRDLPATELQPAERRVILPAPVPVYLFGFSKESSAALARLA